MKIYKREIKPYIQPPQLQGFNDKPFPVKGYDWVSEELEDKLRNEIIVDDPWSKLIFVERYVVLGDGVLGKWEAEWIYDHLVIMTGAMTALTALSTLTYAQKFA